MRDLIFRHRASYLLHEEETNGFQRCNLIDWETCVGAKSYPAGDLPRYNDKKAALYADRPAGFRENVIYSRNVSH